MSTKVIKHKLKNRKRMVNNNEYTDYSRLNIEELFDKAVQMHKSDNLEDAKALYDMILTADPSNADAHHLIGLIAYQTGNNQRAVEYIEKAIASNPTMPHYHNNLGNAFLNSDKNDRAVLCFKEALCLKPDYVEALNNLGNALKKKGKNEEAKVQYLKAIQLVPDYYPAINNLANLLKDEGLMDEAIVHYRRVVTLKPELAEAYFNLGNALNELDNPNDAVEQYRKALSINPDSAEVHSNLGNVLKKSGKYDDAVKHYNTAICLKPDYAEAYNNLSDVYRILGEFDKAIELAQESIQKRPDIESAYVNLGNIYFAHGNYSASIEQYQRALKIRPDYPDAHYNKGLVLLMKGEFQEGWKEYGWRFKSKEIADQINYRELGIPEWDGTSLNGKTILIRSEQGLGDQIQFARYIPLIKEMGGRVIFECHKELMPLFESYNDIDRLVEKPYNSDCVENVDVCVQLLNLPGIFGASLDNILADVPYLKTDTVSVEKWEARFNRASFKIGIVWAGNPNHGNDRNRSCKLTDFTLLSSIPEVELFNLQKGGMSEKDERQLTVMQVTDLGKELNDFSDTASIIENLDLVISVDTSVAHLAGALGRHVWTLLPFIPDWRWMLDRDDTPWYPTMKLFRQRKPGDWEEVLERVSVKLTDYIKGRDETK